MNKLVELAININLNVSYSRSEMKKPKSLLLLSRICKQVTWKCSTYGMYIELPFCIERSLI